MNWQVAYEFTDEDKKHFAAELLRQPKEPYKAAVAVFGASKEEVGKCSYVAMHWPGDREVIAFTHDLLKDGGVANFLPTKEEVARRVWEWTENAISMDDKIKAAKLLCEIQDYIAKPGTNVNVHVTNRVMEVPVAMSDEAWEQAAAAQQAQLTRDAVAVVKH